MATFKRILVLCEGNYCRSPMAEFLLRASLGPEVSVESAGLGALHGSSAAPEAEALMTDRGLDISSHRARQLTKEIALAADLILVMEKVHRRRLQQRFATHLRGKRVVCLDIPDD